MKPRVIFIESDSETILSLIDEKIGEGYFLIERDDSQKDIVKVRMVLRQLHLTEQEQLEIERIKARERNNLARVHAANASLPGYPSIQDLLMKAINEEDFEMATAYQKIINGIV